MTQQEKSLLCRNLLDLLATRQPHPGSACPCSVGEIAAQLHSSVDDLTLVAANMSAAGVLRFNPDAGELLLTSRGYKLVRDLQQTSSRPAHQTACA